MTREEAAYILDPETTRTALAPYAYDPDRRLAVVKEAHKVAVEALRAVDVSTDLLTVATTCTGVTTSCAPLNKKTNQPRRSFLERKLAAATHDLHEIMLRGTGNVDTCSYCTNGQCYGRGGRRGCEPKWRGEED